MDASLSPRRRFPWVWIIALLGLFACIAVVWAGIVAFQLSRFIGSTAAAPGVSRLVPTPHTPADVIAAFQDAGLEAESPTPMTREDYGLAPLVAEEGIRFVIPSLCDDCGGRVLSFKSRADLDKMKSYYDRIGKASAAFFSHVFTLIDVPRGDYILVQINGDLPDDAAAQYGAALESLR